MLASGVGHTIAYKLAPITAFMVHLKNVRHQGSATPSMVLVVWCRAQTNHTALTIMVWCGVEYTPHHSGIPVVVWCGVVVCLKS